MEECDHILSRRYEVYEEIAQHIAGSAIINACDAVAVSQSLKLVVASYYYTSVKRSSVSLWESGVGFDYAELMPKVWNTVRY